MTFSSDEFEDPRVTNDCSIAKDTRRMINNPDYSDVRFICKDGTPVYGNRFFLAARNEYFRSMFCNGWAESGRSGLEVVLPETSSTALLSVMEMLYTNTLDPVDRFGAFPVDDWRGACETMIAAKSYLMPKLHDAIWGHLKDNAEKAKGHIEEVIKRFSLAVEFVPTKSFDLLSRYFSRIMLFASLMPEHLQCLSQDAVLHFLQVTETCSVDSETNPHVRAHTEMERFRIVVLWCACKEFALYSHPDPYMTNPQEGAYTLKILEYFSNRQEPECNSSLQAKTKKKRDVFGKFVRSRLAPSVSEYLPLIDFRHFAPDDLVHIVAPMSIVPAFRIKVAKAFQKLQTPLEVALHTLSWVTNRIHKVSEDGRRIVRRIQQQKAVKGGRAIYGLCAVGRAGGIYEWEITIEEVCRSYIEVGMLPVPDSDGLPSELSIEDDSEVGPFEYARLIHRRLSYSLSEDGYAFRMDDTGISIHALGCRTQTRRFGKNRYHGQMEYGKHFARKNSKVRVCLDLSKAGCSVCVDDENFGLAWSSLPLDKNYYPAVSLGKGAQGAIRITVLRSGHVTFEMRSNGVMTSVHDLNMFYNFPTQLMSSSKLRNVYKLLQEPEDNFLYFPQYTSDTFYNPGFEAANFCQNLLHSRLVKKCICLRFLTTVLAGHGGI